MSAHPIPPNPCLVAITLVVNTSSDPSIVFHYPPRPGEDNSRFKDLFKDNTMGEESSTSSSEDSQDSATGPAKPKLEHEPNDKKDSPPDGEGAGSGSPEKFVPKSGRNWNDLFGYQSSILAKLLSPATSGHKKKFEVGLGDKVMIGRPIFARPDGTWKKAKKARRSSSRSGIPTEKSKKGQEEERQPRGEYSGTEEKDSSEASEPASSAVRTSGAYQDTQKDTAENLDKAGAEEKVTVLKRSKMTSKMSTPLHNTKRPLVMFNVVYILQPPPLEHHLRIGEMYDHIVRKFSKALKWEQAHSNYVSNEVGLIASITKGAGRDRVEKQSLSTMYHDIITQSSLARAISTLYNSVSNLRIAHINLSPSLSLSLQIPVISSMSSLPSPLSPQLPGLWLTTANSMPADDDTQTTSTHLGSHFTLLLLSDLHSILTDVEAASSPITDALTHYLRVSTPTKSFYQISQSSGIPLEHIQFLASHLIYWRRARAVPPLHQRDTYIVSPNADMRKISSAASTFTKLFPALPSLPHILSVLSSRVRPYSSLIPSKDHKQAYMDILAWLMRGGWVTQLRTFAWVKVPGHIKEVVTTEKASNEQSRSPGSSETEESQSESFTEDSDNPSSSHLRIPPTHLSHDNRSPSPSSSTHTTLPFPQTTSHEPPTLIPNPNLAPGLPSRHLSAISKYILQRNGSESQSAWIKCVKYFDGRHALETIPVREGWKRKKVKELLDGWVELGVLVRGRHW